MRGAGRTHEVCPCAVEAPGLDEGAEGEYGLSTGDAPSHAGALQSLCDEGLAGGFDPRFREGRLGADGEALFLHVLVSHALAVFSEEGEFALDFGAVPFCPVAEVAQRPDHLGDALGIVTQDMAVCLEPAGVYRMVGGCPEMLAGVPEVDDLGLWREGLKEGPVVCGAVSDGGDGAPGAQSADLRDLACELRLQRELAAFGHAAEIEGLQPLALAVVEGDRAAGGLAPAGFGAPGLAGPQRHHDAVERDGGAHRVLRDVAGVPDGGRRLRAEVLPALMHAPGEAQQGAR